MKLCECSGSIAFVHEACIIEWIETRIVCEENCLIESIPTPLCEICKTSYNANIKIDRE
jgi:E3 ubiquitin-protein ligase DOA10